MISLPSKPMFLTLLPDSESASTSESKSAQTNNNQIDSTKTLHPQLPTYIASCCTPSTPSTSAITLLSSSSRVNFSQLSHPFHFHGPNHSYSHRLPILSLSTIHCTQRIRSFWYVHPCKKDICRKQSEHSSRPNKRS